MQTIDVQSNPRPRTLLKNSPELKLKFIRQTQQMLKATYINSHYQKNKETFLWILHELDIQPRKFKTILSIRTSYYPSWNKWIITRPKGISQLIKWNRPYTKSGIWNFCITKWTGYDAQTIGIRRYTNTKYRRGDQCLDSPRQFRNYCKWL